MDINNQGRLRPEETCKLLSVNLELVLRRGEFPRKDQERLKNCKKRPAEGSLESFVKLGCIFSSFTDLPSYNIDASAVLT